MIRKIHKLGFIFAISVFVSSCSIEPDDPYFKKSPEVNAFDYQGTVPFSNYVKYTRGYLKRNRVFFNDSNRAEELEQVAPFEWDIPNSCPSESRRGVLLVHGLSDTAYIMKDLAQEFHKQCFLVRSILLPGHGTRPKDIVDIEFTDWIEAVDYGVRSLRDDVDQFYIAGFSLGGLLAANALLDHNDLQGAVLFAPALGVNAPLLTWNTIWLRHLIDWVDIDPPTEAPRYQSMTTNGIAQTYLLAQHFNDRLKKRNQIDTPVMLVQSMEDIAIRPELNLEIFEKHMSHPKSGALVFSGRGMAVNPRPKLRRVGSFLPAKKIVNLSHVSIPYSPANKLYGSNGSYKACGQHVGIVSKQQAEDCMKSTVNWKGEIGSENDEEFYPFQRLTFNPFFNLMAREIERFLKIK